MQQEIAKVFLIVKKTKYILKEIILSLGIFRLFKKVSNKNNYISSRVDEDFGLRMRNILECEDWKKIQYKPNAGVLDWPIQHMHNGIKINAGSYYSHSFTKLFEMTKGVHEPQEEYAFQEVLPFIPNNGVMIELGAFWAFYSMWYKQEKPNGKCFLIEPFLKALQEGKDNAKLNHLELSFSNYIIGKDSGKIELGFDTNHMINLNDFSSKYNIDFIDLLHSDIQGFEFDMLLGADYLLKNKRIGFLFISTHSNEIHLKCKDLLQSYDYQIMVDCNLDETFCHDGIIVAQAIGYSTLESISIHKKSKNTI